MVAPGTNRKRHKPQRGTLTRPLGPVYYGNLLAVSKRVQVIASEQITVSQIQFALIDHRVRPGWTLVRNGRDLAFDAHRFR